MKSLLIIAPRYPHAHDSVSGSFVQSQVAHLRTNFDKVMVISTTPFIPKSLSRWLSPRLRGDAQASSYSCGNVDIYFPRDVVVPFGFFERLRVAPGYASVLRILNTTGFKPDLVHAHFLWPSGVLALRLKNDLGIPYVVTANGYDVYDLPFRSEYYTNELKKVLDNADAVIAVANQLRTSMMARFHLAGDRVTVIPNGYDPELFHPTDQQAARKKLNLPLKGKFILSVGNSQYQKAPKGVIEVKGHRYLSEAFYQLSQTRKDVLCGIIGNVPEREVSPQAQLTGRFKLFGPRSHNEIPDWINACDVFVLSSLNEGVPTVLFESLGCGKPFVGTRVGGIPDIINSDKLGILVEPGDAAALAKAILTTLDSAWDPQYILEYSQQYTWEQIAGRICDVYLDAVQ